MHGETKIAREVREVYKFAIDTELGVLPLRRL